MSSVVVLIEPNPLHAKLFSDLVRFTGYHCITALSGREGSAITFETQPDLVILDIVLPDCDGRDIILNIRRDERTANIPIIVLTAADDIQNEYECRAFGATAFVSKPVHLSELMDKMEAAISATVSNI